MENNSISVICKTRIFDVVRIAEFTQLKIILLLYTVLYYYYYILRMITKSLFYSIRQYCVYVVQLYHRHSMLAKSPFWISFYSECYEPANINSIHTAGDTSINLFCFCKSGMNLLIFNGSPPPILHQILCSNSPIKHNIYTY